MAFSFLWAGGLALAVNMMQYRPHFIALALVFLAAGFYFAYRSEKLECAPGTVCAMPKSRKLQTVSLRTELNTPYKDEASMTKKLTAMLLMAVFLAGAVFAQTTGGTKGVKAITIRIDGFELNRFAVAAIRPSRNPSVQ